LKPGAVLAQIGFDQIFSFWERFLSWRLALRVSLVNMTLLWAWGVVALAGAFGGRRRIWLGLFGFAAAVQWQVYMGFFSYYVATGFGFYVIAVAAWRPKWNLVWRTTLAAGLACQALLHPVPAVMCGLVVAAIALWRAPAGGLLRESARLAAMAFPAALVVLAGTGSGRSATRILESSVDRARGPRRHGLRVGAPVAVVGASGCGAGSVRFRGGGPGVAPRSLRWRAAGVRACVRAGGRAWAVPHSWLAVL
jgi:hypothetical protein